jgi:hypothetical protein
VSSTWRAIHWRHFVKRENAYLLLAESLDFLRLFVKLRLQVLQVVLRILYLGLGCFDLRSNVGDVIFDFLQRLGQLLKFGFDIFQALPVTGNRALELGRVFLRFGHCYLCFGDLFVCDVDMQLQAIDFGLLREQPGSADIEDLLLESLDGFFDRT